MATFTRVMPPPGEQVIQVGIIINGKEYGRTRDGRLVKMVKVSTEIPDSEAEILAMKMRGLDGRASTRPDTDSN